MNDKAILRAYKALAAADKELADTKKRKVSARNKLNATIANTKVKKIDVAMAHLELAERGIKQTQANVANRLGVDIKTLRKIIKE